MDAGLGGAESRVFRETSIPRDFFAFPLPRVPEQPTLHISPVRIILISTEPAESIR
jgi:hypothetical protein